MWETPVCGDVFLRPRPEEEEEAAAAAETVNVKSWPLVCLCFLCENHGCEQCQNDHDGLLVGLLVCDCVCVWQDRQRWKVRFFVGSCKYVSWMSNWPTHPGWPSNCGHFYYLRNVSHVLHLFLGEKPNSFEKNMPKLRTLFFRVEVFFFQAVTLYKILKTCRGLTHKE